MDSKNKEPGITKTRPAPLKNGLLQSISRLAARRQIAHQKDAAPAPSPQQIGKNWQKTGKITKNVEIVRNQEGKIEKVANVTTVPSADCMDEFNPD